MGVRICEVWLFARLTLGAVGGVNVAGLGAARPCTMFSERRYDRFTNDYDRRPTSALVWLLCALVAGFVIQMVFERLFLSSFFANAAAFSPVAARGLRVWTFVSYAFLHAGALHLLVNSLMIYFMGREVLPLLGNRRFVTVALAAAAGGALLWFAVHHNIPTPKNPGDVVVVPQLVGASAISLALLILFACFNPNSPITVLLFFVIPVTIRPKYLAAIAIAFDLGGLVFYELPARQDALPIAHSAHLGGVLVAFGYYFLVHRREWRNPDGVAGSGLLPEWLRLRKKPAAIASPKYKVNMSSSTTATPASAAEKIRVEVDRILDKINNQGFASLTEEEKRTLDSAKDVLGGAQSAP